MWPQCTETHTERNDVMDRFQGEVACGAHSQCKKQCCPSLLSSCGGSSAPTWAHSRPPGRSAGSSCRTAPGLHHVD